VGTVSRAWRMLVLVLVLALMLRQVCSPWK
jgi:hypothetical protein